MSYFPIQAFPQTAPMGAGSQPIVSPAVSRKVDDPTAVGSWETKNGEGMTSSHSLRTGRLAGCNDGRCGWWLVAGCTTTCLTGKPSRCSVEDLPRHDVRANCGPR